MADIGKTMSGFMTPVRTVTRTSRKFLDRTLGDLCWPSFAYVIIWVSLRRSYPSAKLFILILTILFFRLIALFIQI